MTQYILDYLILPEVEVTEQRKKYFKVITKKLLSNKQVNVTIYVCAV